MQIMESGAPEESWWAWNGWGRHLQGDEFKLGSERGVGRKRLVKGTAGWGDGMS